MTPRFPNPSLNPDIKSVAEAMQVRYVSSTGFEDVIVQVHG